jgi:hypothetical protein
MLSIRIAIWSLLFLSHAVLGYVAGIPWYRREVAERPAFGGVSNPFHTFSKRQGFGTPNFPPPSPPSFPSTDFGSDFGGSSGSDTSSPPCPKGCLCHPGGPKIYFINGSSEILSPFYLLRTSWRVQHPKQIRKSLRQAGFTVVDVGSYNGNVNHTRTIEDCGWNRLTTFNRKAAKLGKFDVNGTDELPLGETNIDITIGKIMPYPYVEITMICAFLFGPLVTLFFLVVTQDLPRWRSKERARKDREALAKLEEKCRRRTIARRAKFTWSPPQFGDSRLLLLPTELHLDITGCLDYHSLRNVSQTCRFYHQLTPGPTLEEKQKEYRVYLQNLDHQMSQKKATSRSNQSSKICFSCLQVKLNTEFRRGDRDDLYVQSSGGPPKIDKYGACVACILKKANRVNGVSFNTPGRVEISLCGQCGVQQELEDSAVRPAHWGARMDYGGWWCTKCSSKLDGWTTSAVGVRMAQLLLSFVLFCTSLTGE